MSSFRNTAYQRRHGSLASRYEAKKQEEKEQERIFLTRDSGQLIKTIKFEDIYIGSANPVIQDCSFVASYNWLDAEKPTVLVPGASE